MASGSGAFERKLAMALFGLPAPLQRALVGFKPIERDGQRLDLQTQLMLTLMKLQPPFNASVTPAAMRANYRRTSALLAPPPPPGVAATPLTLRRDGPAIAARLYTPERLQAAGAGLVFYHGGGWVIGDLDTHDAACRLIAAEAGVPVLAIAYRLAPEDRLSAAIADAVAAFRWARDHAAEIGWDPRRIAVAGDSAGGHLAAVTAQELLRAGEPGPCYQWLIYPATDAVGRYRSSELFADGFLLTQALIAWFHGHTADPATPPEDPRVSPLLAPSLAGLPPALIVTAGFDPLRDQGFAYAEKLRAAGVRVEYVCHAGLVHGYLNALGVLAAGRAALVAAARTFGRAMTQAVAASEAEHDAAACEAERRAGASRPAERRVAAS